MDANELDVIRAEIDRLSLSVVRDGDRKMVGEMLHDLATRLDKASSLLVARAEAEQMAQASVAAFRSQVKNDLMIADCDLPPADDSALARSYVHKDKVAQLVAAAEEASGKECFSALYQKPFGESPLDKGSMTYGEAIEQIQKRRGALARREAQVRLQEADVIAQVIRAAPGTPAILEINDWLQRHRGDLRAALTSKTEAKR